MPTGARPAEPAPGEVIPRQAIPNAANESPAPPVPAPGAATQTDQAPGAAPPDVPADRAARVVRMLVVWCPDWPVVAACAGTPSSPAVDPVAVVAANRVLATSAVARSRGVRRGMRRRDAQGNCPELVVFPAAPERDAVLFEPVAAAVEELAPGIEVVYPGVVAVPARGVCGYFGGEQAAAENLVDHVAARARVECQIGVADGLFAAVLAARRGALVVPGRTPDFLAPLAIGELAEAAGDTEGSHPERAELIETLGRLGLRTLGAFAALPAGDVAARFGRDAVLAHRLANGHYDRPPVRRRPAPELAVSRSFDPAVDRVDLAAFAARTLAEKLCATLGAHGLACTRLGIDAVTEHGEELRRVWRMAEPATAPGIANRVRWQLEGWLTSVERPSGGIRTLRLEPEELVRGNTLQVGMFGDGDDEATERAGRALVRVQGLLGPEGVRTAVFTCGRGPAERVVLVPWGDEPPRDGDQARTWPGRLPQPSPATVPTARIVAAVLDDAGAEVGVTGRYELTAAPFRVFTGGEAPRPVLAWAGPWPAEERWWGRARRRARLQVLLGGDGAGEPDPAARGPDLACAALLLVRENGRWLVEGIYD